ncbi:bacteriocin immunity protein [Enterococcus sp. BWB1-3]|uniref:bacteriocin immunity protein n=1 Tax=Enterococcus sp. BWB1-3 TaxID=2787713 RepID=UPI001922AB19|nr:bacteriocin immunity protein [Enterococcus sp. BWB1-3]MBL1229680.1 bacteriocin immunity protein [Enterococcus sp. BWB1-3]
MEKSKDIVHELYINLSKYSGNDMDELREVLLKVYSKLGSAGENPPLINHLVNFIYFKEVNERLSFTDSQQKLIRQLFEIGSKSAFNGVYRSDFVNTGQFD